jgi:hypothetical protein
MKTNVGKDVGKNKISLTAGGNVIQPLWKTV